MLWCIAVVEFPDMNQNEMEPGEIATWIQGALMRDGDAVNVTVFPADPDLLAPILEDSDAYKLGRVDAEEFGSEAGNPFDSQKNHLEFTAWNIGYLEAQADGVE